MANDAAPRFALVLALVAGVAAPALAVDISGRWYVGYGTTSAPQLMTVNQVGSAVLVGFAHPSVGLFSPAADGSIDESGAFAVGPRELLDEVGGQSFRCFQIRLEGTVSADGTFMSGIGASAPYPWHGFCAVFGFTWEATRSRCGDGAIDPGEVCDPCPGACDDGDPCTVDTSCQPGECEHWETLCFDGLDCTADRCEAGVCQHIPSDLLCDDGQDCTADSCDAAGLCHNVPAGSLVQLEEKLAIMDDAVSDARVADSPAPRFVRQLERRAAKLRARAVAAAGAVKRERFAALVRKADRSLTAVEKLIGRPRPRPLHCRTELQDALDGVRECLSLVPPPEDRRTGAARDARGAREPLAALARESNRS